MRSLVGRFIVEIDSDKLDDSIIADNKIDPYWVKERISQISLISKKESHYMLTGFFSSHSDILSKDELIDWINECSPNRHYRLMTDEEVKLAYKMQCSYYKSEVVYAR